MLRGLALAGEARAADGDGRGDCLSELDGADPVDGGRAADAPDNFLHLLRLLEAERAWAAGDFQAAVVAFDAARREVARRQRPWHRALIAERAARFYLAHGVDQAGYTCSPRPARNTWRWGATAKVEQLDWAYPTLRPQTAITERDSHDRDDRFARDAVCVAGAELGDQCDRLHARVVEVLGAMTGATGVHLLLWSEDRRIGWYLRQTVTVALSGRRHGTGTRGADVGAALVQRTGERWWWPTLPVMTGCP